MQDMDIPVSGEPYIKKSKLLSLAKEHLLDPLKEFLGINRKPDPAITPLEEEPEDEYDKIEKCWEVLQKAFDEDQITEEQYLTAREKYKTLKKSIAVQTIEKAFDAGLITDNQYFKYLEKSKLVI